MGCKHDKIYQSCSIIRSGKERKKRKENPDFRFRELEAAVLVCQIFSGNN
jgi:hypothetical protein